MTGYTTGPDHAALTDDQVTRIGQAVQPDIRAILRLFNHPVPADHPGPLTIPDELLDAGAWPLYTAALRQATERVLADDEPPGETV